MIENVKNYPEANKPKNELFFLWNLKVQGKNGNEYKFSRKHDSVE